MELRKEFRMETKQDFLLYSMTSFLSTYNESTKSKVSDDVIYEIDQMQNVLATEINKKSELERKRSIWDELDKKIIEDNDYNVERAENLLLERMLLEDKLEHLIDEYNESGDFEIPIKIKKIRSQIGQNKIITDIVNERQLKKEYTLRKKKEINGFNTYTVVFRFNKTNKEDELDLSQLKKCLFDKLKVVEFALNKSDDSYQIELILSNRYRFEYVKHVLTEQLNLIDGITGINFYS